MLLPILEYPNPRLYEISKPVEAVTDEIRKLAADMAETMYEAEGIGLAAPQIGRLLRMIVVDVTGPDRREGLMTFINPKITPLPEYGTVTGEEGCLSVPLDYRAKVTRKACIRIEALDLEGKPVDFVAQDLLSICLQHETDHLDGVLFIDHISFLKRNMYNARLRKELRRQAQEHNEHV